MQIESLTCELLSSAIFLFKFSHVLLHVNIFSPLYLNYVHVISTKYCNLKIKNFVSYLNRDRQGELCFGRWHQRWQRFYPHGDRLGARWYGQSQQIVWTAEKGKKKSSKQERQINLSKYCSWNWGLKVKEGKYLEKSIPEKS